MCGRPGAGLTTRLFQLSARATPDKVPSPTTSPVSGTHLRHQGEILWAVPMLPEPRPTQSWGRKPSVGKHVLTLQGPLGQAGGLGPWWVKVPAWFPSSQSSAAWWGRDERTDSLTLPETWGSKSPFEPQYSGPQNGRGGEPLVKLQGSGGWTRLFLTPGLSPEQSGRMK